MKKLFMYSALLFAATLAGCSNEIGQAESNPTYLEPGTSAMRIAIDFSQPKGYAIGDEDTSIATDAEKEIKSLALFVKTSHAFAKFYSDEQMFSPNGFTQSLVEVEKGKYTASIKVRSVKFEGNSEVIAVANYKENGLDFSEVTNIKQLKQLMTKELDGTTNLAAPLLMYGEDGAVALADQQTVPLALEVTRMVARLDVENNAAEPTDPADAFTLTAVSLLNAPKASMLLPGQSQAFTGVNLPDYALGVDETTINGIYLFETPNDAKTNQPLIEIKGTFRGAQVQRQIPFKIADQPGTPGEYFPILRNYRYKLSIGVAEETKELEFSIQAKDWNTSESILVKPSMKAPKLENFVWGGVETDLATQGITWDESTLTLTLTKPLTENITLSFDATAFQAPKCAVGVEAPNVAFINIGMVLPGEVIGYADTEPTLDPDADEPMPLKRTFTLTLPKDIEASIEKGTTHTNLLKVLVSEAFATSVTVVYEDKRTIE